GTVANSPLDIILIYPLNLGVLGAGIGTASAQTLMAIAACTVVIRRAGLAQSSLRPHIRGIFSSFSHSIPLMIRSLALRITIIAEVTSASYISISALAANQITNMIWSFAVFSLDALATAAQIIVGRHLGAQHTNYVHTIVNRCINRGYFWGVMMTLAWLVSAVPLSFLMSNNDHVRMLSFTSIIVCAFFMPFASVTYMLDGVLIGAGDNKKIALYMSIASGVFVICAGIAPLFTTSWGFNDIYGYIFLWLSYSMVFMGIRTFTMTRRARSDEWIH
ncbi:MAG: MATE family efflux transporter, partial [Actinomycetaceae bacterium]|nr:MATE family efflux transporter [Actinomycetaceae bacterium]